MKRSLCLFTVVLAAVFAVSGLCLASDKGEAEYVLKSTIDPAKKGKPAFFPHAKHQEILKCGDCHHDKGADGKMIAYVEGQKIAQCESCHNTKAGINEKLDTFKEAAHGRCKKCHNTMKKEGKKTGPTKCNGCHKKDLK